MPQFRRTVPLDDGRTFSAVREIRLCLSDPDHELMDEKRRPLDQEL